MINFKNYALALALCLSITACTPTVAQRGNLLEDYQIEQIVTNIHTKSDVLRILGSPTTQAPFDENVWYYIGQETEKRGILDPEITNERIIIIAFNKEDIVQSINDADGERITIPIERSKTATHGNEMTVMQQMLGNLGKFNTDNAGQ